MAEESQNAVEEKKLLNAGGNASEGSQPKIKAPEAEVSLEEDQERGSLRESEGEAEAEGREKPTRAERRIQQLVGKLKEATSSNQESFGDELSQTNTVSDVLGISGRFPWEKGQSPFTPGQEVGIDQLESELNRRAATLAELKVKEVLDEERQRQQLVKTIEDFSGELEKLEKEVPELNQDSPEYDAELDKRLSELIVAVNSDEEGHFLLKKRPAEIYEALRVAMKRAENRGQAETTARMAESFANAAVSPTAGARERKDYEEEAAFREASEEGTTEAWARYLKKRVFKKNP